MGKLVTTRKFYAFCFTLGGILSFLFLDNSLKFAAFKYEPVSQITNSVPSLLPAREDNIQEFQNSAQVVPGRRAKQFDNFEPSVTRLSAQNQVSVSKTRQDFQKEVFPNEPHNIIEIDKREFVPTSDGDVFLEAIGKDARDSPMYMTDNSMFGADPIISFLKGAEKDTVIDWLWRLLAPGNCKWSKQLVQEDNLFKSCLEPNPAGKPKHIMVDVGANAGFMGMLALSWGYDVYSFDPQVHCSQLNRAAAIAANKDHSFHMYNSFSGTSGFSMEVPRRTGCIGTFPVDMMTPLVAETYSTAGISGYQDVYEITSIPLDEVIPDDVVIAAMKIDAEGSEHVVLEGAKKLFTEHRVKNLIMEINKNALKSSLGYNQENHMKTVYSYVGWLIDLGYSFHDTNHGIYNKLDFSSEDKFREWFLEGWLYADAFITLEDNYDAYK